MVAAGVLGLLALADTLNLVIAAVVLGFAVLATTRRIAQGMMLLACAAIVALLTLLGFNVLLGELFELFGAPAYRLPIAAGLVLAVVVFAGGAYFYLLGTWQRAEPPIPAVSRFLARVRARLTWAGLSPGWRKRWAAVGGAGLAIFAILLVPVLATELRQRPDPDPVPAAEIGRGLDVLIVADPPPPASSATEVSRDLLGDREAGDIRFSVARAGGTRVVWTRAGIANVAQVGQALTSTDEPRVDPPTLRPRADAVIVLVAAAGDDVDRWESVKLRVERDVGAGLPVYVLLVGPAPDAWNESSDFDAVSSLADGEAVTDAAVRLSNAFPAGIEHFALALQHRPVLLFDEAETVPRPLSIERLFEKGAVHQCPDDESGGDCQDVTVRNPARLTSPGTHLLIDDEEDLDDLAKRERDAFAAGETAVDRRPLGDASRIYVNPVEAGNRLYLDYWWYLQHNPTGAGRGAFCGAGFVIAGVTCFDHESDWEGVTVVLRRSGAQWVPERVHYAQHESVVRYAWEDLRKYWADARFASLREGDEARPLVFVANGTHAAYPHPCDSDCRQLPADLEEADHDGKLEWVANHTEVCLAVECLRPLPTASGGRGPASWNAFKGSWGTRRCILKYYCDLATPPGAPGGQGRYLDPAHSDGRADPRQPDGGYRAD